MGFEDKLKNYLQEEVVNVADEITPTSVKDINKDPESKQGEVLIQPDIFADDFISANFTQKVKPTVGEVKKGKLMMHHIQLAHKNKDMFVFKGGKETEPFYAIDRDEFVAYVANDENDDEMTADLETLSKKVKMILTREQSELIFDDYINLAIDNIISITTNMPETLQPSDKVPSIKIPEGD